jgi:hypothetical protein
MHNPGFQWEDCWEILSSARDLTGFHTANPASQETHQSQPGLGYSALSTLTAISLGQVEGIPKARSTEFKKHTSQSYRTEKVVWSPKLWFGALRKGGVKVFLMKTPKGSSHTSQKPEKPYNYRQGELLILPTRQEVGEIDNVGSSRT